MRKTKPATIVLSVHEKKKKTLLLQNIDKINFATKFKTAEPSSFLKCYNEKNK